MGLMAKKYQNPKKHKQGQSCRTYMTLVNKTYPIRWSADMRL